MSTHARRGALSQVMNFRSADLTKLRRAERSMLLGYNTNGLAHHDPLEAIELLADEGYGSVALTLDHGLLNPFDRRSVEQLPSIREALQQRRMRNVVETGARFLLDPRRKHEPTLVTAEASGRTRRIDFLRKAIDTAAALRSDCVSLWAGRLRDDVPSEQAWQRLSESLGQVLEYAEARGVLLGFEPEPGMFIDTMTSFAELVQRLPSPQLQLTLDVGHLHCQGEEPIAEVIRQWGPRIVNVHIEDMRRGVHEHLMFGEGEMRFAPIIDALEEVGYEGGLHVELSRHSHEAPSAVRRARDFLQPLMER